MTRAEKENPATIPDKWQPLKMSNPCSMSANTFNDTPLSFEGRVYYPPATRAWASSLDGMERLVKADRLSSTGKNLAYHLLLDDFSLVPINNIWTGLLQRTAKIYIVQTPEKLIARCLQMVTDPGDLVLDPTCGSGTTAYVAEQWGRRWITIDTSRVALALARARIMGARYPYYFLADSREGQLKEAEVSHFAPASQPVHGNIRHGFVYERVPHITLKSIAHNAEIDVIWDKWHAVLEPLRNELNAALKKNLQEWEIPRDAEEKWPDKVKKLHADWWQARFTRQKEIDDSIKAKVEFEFLYDKPYEDKSKVRVAGPFTVESVSPHRVLAVDEKDNVIDGWRVSDGRGEFAAGTPDFASVILENLKTAGVQQAHKADKINFTSLTPWPGKYICAEGLHMAGELKTTASANLFVIFGEPDIEIEKTGDDKVRVRVKGVDVFKPQTGEVVSDGPDGIACWFIDTNYNEESFFVRHAYFLGANDPYKSLKTTLRAEIDEAAWESLHSDTSRPFPKPETGRIAVKVINHLGDEVMKVFAVS